MSSRPVHQSQQRPTPPIAPARRSACYQVWVCKNVATVRLNRRVKGCQIDAFDLDESPDAEAEVGSRRHYRFHTSAAADVHRLSGRDRQDHGTQGCVAGWSRVRNPDDSILHQSRREEPECTTTHRTREGEADSAPASRQTEAGREEAVTGGFVDLSQTTVLITGSTDGVGTLVATRAAAAGARILVHGRSDAKGRDTLGNIQRETPRSHAEYYRADLASLDDVRRLADEVRSAHDRLDILINNAGIGFGRPSGRREISLDGHELRLAVNYLAPYLLRHLLLPTLRRSVPSRIVNVASIGQAPIDFDDVMLTREYDGRQAYGQSKLALVMLTFDLAVTLQGTGVTANAIHPATLMNTKMVAEAGLRPQSTVQEGAEAIFHLATSPELDGVSGRFFDGRREARAHPAGYDSRERQRLRELALELTGQSADITR
jgi:NAD(P)-dependent dehydrogenase (short-subunit alcohol dehydrogenase family)